jgi:DNA repair photolyase
MLPLDPVFSFLCNIIIVSASNIKIREIESKTILSSLKIYDYVVNPYVGCQHGCSYCYARFMKRFTGHKEAWGVLSM